MKPVQLLRYRKKSLHALSLAAALLMGGAQAAADLQVTMTGTTRAVTDGQATYIIEVRNTAPIAVTGTNNATDFNLNITLPTTLSDVFWDCNSVITNTASNCGTASTGTNTGTSLTLTGLDLPQNSGDVLRITVQGRVGASGSGTITANASVSNTNDPTPGSASLTTAVVNLPSGCNNFDEITLLDAGPSIASTWPLYSTTPNSVSTSGTGIVRRTTPNVQPPLTYRPDINFTSPSGTALANGSFSYTLTFANAVPAREVFLSILDVNLGSPNISITVTGGASPENFAPIRGRSASSVFRALAYSSTGTTGQVYRQVNDAQESIADYNLATKGDLNLIGVGDELVKSITVTKTDTNISDAIAFNYGAQEGCADPTVRLLGTAQTLQDGQATYILEAYDNDPASQVFSRFARNVDLTINLPTSLSDIFFDCNSSGEASCGTPATGNNAAQNITVRDIRLVEGGPNAGRVRLLAQGRATQTGTIQAVGSVAAPNDTDISNNTATLTTTVQPFPELCPNVQEIRRVDSAAATQPWPMNPSNTVTTSVTGGTSSAPRGTAATAMKYRPTIELTSPPNSQQTSGNFTYTMTFAQPVPAREVFFSVLDFNLGAPNLTVSVSGGATAANFAPILTNDSGPEATASGVIRPGAYDSTGLLTGSSTVGQLYRQVTRSQQDVSSNPGTVRNSVRFIGQGTELVKSITVTGTNVPAGEELAFNYGAQARCAVYSVTKEVDTDLIEVGDDGSSETIGLGTLTYTITVTNTGTATGTNVTTTDTLENRLKNVSSPSANAVVDGQRVTFTTPSLPVGDFATYVITAQPEVTAGTQQGPIQNVASALSSDPFVASEAVNSNTVSTNVVYLRLRKQVRNVTTSTGFGTSATGQNGDTLEYCIDATNYGSLPVSDAVIRDSIAATTTPNLNGYGSGLGVRQTVGNATTDQTSTGSDSDGASLDTTGGQNEENPGLMTSTIGSLAPGATARTCFQVTVNKRP